MKPRTETVWLCGNCGYEHNSIEVIVATEDLARQWLRGQRRDAISKAHRSADWNVKEAIEHGWEPRFDRTPTRIIRIPSGWKFTVVHDSTYITRVPVLRTLSQSPPQRATE